MISQEHILLEQGLADRHITNTVTISVVVYYTKQFEEITSNINGHVAALIDGANAAFRNSNMPTRLKLHCILPSNINERSNMNLLSTFRGLKGE